MSGLVIVHKRIGQCLQQPFRCQIESRASAKLLKLKTSDADFPAREVARRLEQLWEQCQVYFPRHLDLPGPEPGFGIQSMWAFCEKSVSFQTVTRIPTVPA